MRRSQRWTRNKRLTSPLCVEVLLYLRQQVGSVDSYKVFLRQPGIIQHIFGGGPFDWVNSETTPDEFFRFLGHVLPIFNGFKLVVTGDDGLRLLGLRVPIERRITAEEEIGDDAHSPDVNWFVMASYVVLY